MALHRVKHLLQRSPHSRILLTTYTTALAKSLRGSLALLLDEDDVLLRRVDVTTVDALARDVVRRGHGSVPKLCDDSDERFRWRKVRRSLGLGWSEQFLSQEYRHVVLAQSIATEEAYLRAVRHGRGTALGPVKRVQVWQAMKMFEQGLRNDGKCTYLELCAEAARLLREPAAGEPPYAHVVVDEAQDLHPAQWRVLRGAVASGPDDLFITGDPHQRIYDSRVSLGSLGIPVAGRSSRLRINYRSTEEILRWAARLMQDEPVESLSGEGMDSPAGYRSLLHGRRPALEHFNSEEDELAAVVERIHGWAAGGAAPADIAVTSRFHQTLDKIKARLEQAGLPAALVKEGPSQQDPGVRLATLHAMKGLEFRCVAVIGVTAGALPFPPAVTPPEVDQLQHQADMLTERCLLFVACTRAREELAVSYSGRASRFLPHGS